jgi:hypothetical protein
LAGLESTLIALKILLDRYGRDGQAALITEALMAYSDDYHRFSELIGGGDFWGGAGAVWEVEFQPTPTAPKSNVENDQVLFRCLLVKLVDELDRMALATPAALALRRILS